MIIFCRFLTIILQLADHALSELSGQPNTAIPASSSHSFVPARSNFDEIRLKQVSIFPFGRFHHTFCLHWPYQFYSPLRHKNLQTIVCFLFKLELSPRKKEKKQHQLDRPRYLTRLRPNFRNLSSF